MSLVAGIALDANQDRRLELTAISLDKAGGLDAVWHAWQAPTGAWGGWHEFGRPGEPAGYNPPRLLVELAGRRRALELEIAQQSDAQMKR
jgi:hypothetical protein